METIGFYCFNTWMIQRNGNKTWSFLPLEEVSVQILPKLGNGKIIPITVYVK